MSVVAVTVLTHRRPDELKEALELLQRLAAETGATLRFDPDETAKHGIAAGRGSSPTRPWTRTWTCAWSWAATGRSSPRCAITRGTQVPVFAVNYGAVGFLATVDPDRVEEGLRRALTGEFERMELPALRCSRDRRPVLARDQRRLLPPQAGPARGRPVVRDTARTRSGGCAATGSSCPRPRGRPATTSPTGAGDGLGGRGLRGVLHRAALAYRAGAGGAPGDVLTVANRSRAEPVDVPVDGRPVCELARARTSRCSSASSTACSPSCRARRSTTGCASASGAWPSNPSHSFVTTSCRSTRTGPIRRRWLVDRR